MITIENTSIQKLLDDGLEVIGDIPYDMLLEMLRHSYLEAAKNLITNNDKNGADWCILIVLKIEEVLEVIHEQIFYTH